MPATDDDFSLPPGIPRHWHAELSPPINIKSLVAPGRLTTLSEAVHYVDSKLGEMGENELVIGIVQALSHAAETGAADDITEATQRLASLLQARGWLD